MEDVNSVVGKAKNEPRVGGKESISSVFDLKNTIVQNSDIEESSAEEKRAAKRQKQKDRKKLLTNDSTEVAEDKKKAKKRPSKNAVENGTDKKDIVENDSGFDDCCRLETLGLASVKNDGLITPRSELSEGSENGKNVSDCSEVISPSQLDIDDIFRSLVAEKTAGNGFENACIDIGNLPHTLDQQSSVTDSSGVETSSDADSDHAMYVIDSADQKFDVPNGQHPDLHHPDDSACEQEAGFITVSKKRKPRSLPVDRNDQSMPPFSSTDSVSPDSGESSPQQERNTSISSSRSSSGADRPTVHKKLPENSLSLGSTAHTRLDSEPCFVKQSATSFDVQHQPCESVLVPTEKCSAEERITDDNSIDLDRFWCRASLSDITLDDFAFSCLLKETLEDDWTVVKNGRRSKNNVQSVVDPMTPGENKLSVPVNVGQCSVIREQNACEYGRGKVSTFSGRGRFSAQSSRCKSFDGSNSKTFDHCRHNNGSKIRPQDASQKNFYPSGVARSNSSAESKYRGANCDILSKCDSNREVSSLESNSVPVRLQEIPRFSQKHAVPKSVVPMKNNCAIVASSGEGAKTALITMTGEPAGDRTKNTEGLSSEKARLSTESSNLTLHASEKTFITRGAFSLIEAQVYLYRGKTSQMLVLLLSLVFVKD